MIIKKLQVSFAFAEKITSTVIFPMPVGNRTLIGIVKFFPQTPVKNDQKTIKFHGKIAGFVLYLKNVFVYYFKEPW
jgi:hypothetical protein